MDEMETTLIGCPPAEARQDDWFKQLVASQPVLTLDGTQVILRQEDIVATFIDGDWP